MKLSFSWPNFKKLLELNKVLRTIYSELNRDNCAIIFSVQTKNYLIKINPKRSADLEYNY